MPGGQSVGSRNSSIPLFFIHCSNEAHNVFPCAPKQKLLCGFCAVGLILGDSAPRGQVGSSSAVLAEETILSQVFPAQWPKCPRKNFPKIFLVLTSGVGGKVEGC